MEKQVNQKKELFFKLYRMVTFISGVCCVAAGLIVEITGIEFFCVMISCSIGAYLVAKSLSLANLD